MKFGLVFLCTFLMIHLKADTYHVDFAGGNNRANGRSPQTAWKQAPGDSEATDVAADTKLKPGDTLRFKGGVAYHGTLQITVSGTEDAPITFDGNFDGTWGDGPAILDGGRIIEGWKRVSSPNQVDGNPKWQEMFIADVDVDIHPNVSHGEVVIHRKQKTERQAPWQRVILIDAEKGLLPVAQFPKPEDTFFPDLPSDFLESAEPLQVDSEKTVIKDTELLRGKIPGTLEGAFAGFHAGNNHVYFARIRSHDTKAGELELPPYKGRTYKVTKYALYNTPAIISDPGEWAINSLGPGKSQVVLLPPLGNNGLPANVAFPEKQAGIIIQEGASHIQIQGFLIKRFAGGQGGISVARSGSRSKDILIEKCEIRNLSGQAGIMLHYCDDIVIRNCLIHHNPGWTVGVFLNRVNGFELTNNQLNKNSGSGFRHYDSKDGRIIGNQLINHHGMHSSGINLYEGCRNIHLENNYLTDVIAINRSVEDLVFRNNIIDIKGRRGFAIAMWSSGSVGGRHIKNVLFENNTFVRAEFNGIFLQGKGLVTEGLVLRNNTLSSSNKLPRDTVIEGNIFMKESGGELPEGNKVESDLSRLIRDPDIMNFRRVPGGPLPTAGAIIR